MFTNPKENIKHLYVKEGDIVADFGSGAGHYIEELSKQVGPSGKVYAVDIQKDLLLKISNDLNSKNIKNFEIIWGDLEIPEGSKISSGALDSVILSNLLFQVDNKKSVVKEVWRVLKNGAKVLVVDWSDSFGGVGPSPKDVFTEENALRLFSENGFSLLKKVPAGAHHYGLIFIKS
jgi:ubiquinone/menaquinone biosynthesis C-methylase UbiE